jgi:uncharacterized membrane protein (DUF106 family)
MTPALDSQGYRCRQQQRLQASPQQARLVGKQLRPCLWIKMVLVVAWMVVCEYQHLDYLQRLIDLHTSVSVVSIHLSVVHSAAPLDARFEAW